MDHVAIMQKSWGLIPKILSGEKTIESRWYKTKRTPWDKIKKGDTVYFKNSGEPVSIKAKVTEINQFEIENNKEAFEIMSRFKRQDLGTNSISQEIKNYISDKNYAIFVWFDKVQKIKPFNIDKSGFGAMSAWINVRSINQVKL